MDFAQLWFRVISWFTNLDSKKALIALFAIVVTALFLQNYNLKEENDRLHSNATTVSNRNDSIKGVLQRQNQECEEEKFKIVQQTSEYWAKRYDEMEKRLYQEYKTVEEIKSKKRR